MRTGTSFQLRASGALALLVALLVTSVATAAPSVPPGTPVPWGKPSAARTLRFSGQIGGGQRFERVLGDGLRFVLVPLSGGSCEGWTIGVVGSDSTADFSAPATPPFHGLNSRSIEAWHFRNADNTGPNQGEVNAPQEERGFTFFLSRPDYDVASQALEVMLWPDSRRDSEQDSANASYGRLPQGEGLLVIREMALDRLGAGQTPCFASMRFDVELRFPAQRVAARRPRRP